MQQQLMEILVCPMCKGELELKIEKEDAGEIVTGSITCTNGPRPTTSSTRIRLPSNGFILIERFLPTRTGSFGFLEVV